MQTKYSPTGESWGLSTHLDLHGCNDRVKSKDAIRNYVITLCDEVIHMKRHGDCLIEYFGNPNDGLEGYSVFQFIETSSIDGHFCDSDDSCYIDVFSCAEYDPEEVEKFTKAYFGATDCEVHVVVRMFGKNSPRNTSA